jgi:Cu+-exporting ATPase
MAYDPVCGSDIHPKTSQWLVEYHGEVFHFCTSVCRDKFVDNPQEFIVSLAEISIKEAQKPKQTVAAKAKNVSTVIA